MDTPRSRPLEERIAVAAMALLVVITLLNVITRYLTDESFAWTEEISVFLMIVLTLAGAASTTLGDRHIRIEYFYDSGSPARRRRLRLLSALVCTAFFLLFTGLYGVMVWDEVRWGETSMGLGIPRWWYSVWALPLLAAITVRCAVLARNAWRAPPDEPSSPTPTPTV
ncbi:MAG TPA: TRAP transporter small permease [Burkholderiaceae bacterium]|nr:TRAP transporter small permease [Burkholderiaceae bacterium]